jgi:hypothetical protein
MKAVLPLLLALAACSTGSRALVTTEHSRSLTLQLSGPVTADSAGCVFALTPVNVVRYDPSAHEIEELLFENAPLAALSAVPDGPLLVLAGRRLEAVAAGRRVPIVDLPGEGLLLASRRGAAYVAVRVGADVDVLRYRFAERTLEPLFRSGARPSALAAVPGGCLVAMGSGVHKVFDPDRGQVVRRLLFASSAPALSGLAADPDSRTIFFSDGEETYAWKEGRIWPLFPAGGALAAAAGRVVVADSRHGQLFDLPIPPAPSAVVTTEPVRPDPADVLQAWTSDLSATWQPEGLAVAFKVVNDSDSWVDRIEVKVTVRATDDSALLETTLALPMSVAPRSSRDRRLDLPAALVPRDRVKDVSVRMVRARASTLHAKLAVTLREVRTDGDLFVGVTEITNGNAGAVRLRSFDALYTDGKGRAQAAPSRLSCDVRLGPGETRVVELPLITNDDALRLGDVKRVELWIARVEAAE